VLGIYPTAVGGAAVKVSPRLSGLSWARGATQTINGPVSVSWSLEGKTLHVDISAPPATRAAFESNETLAGLKVIVNGHRKTR